VNGLLRIVVLVSLLAAGCAGVVDYSRGNLQRYDDNTRYHVRHFPNGMQVSVRTDVYQFIPIPSSVTEQGMSSLRFIAREQAAKLGKSIKPISDEEVKFSSGRDILTGTTSWSGTAIVKFQD
jgi:hypothetical protein